MPDEFEEKLGLAEEPTIKDKGLKAAIEEHKKLKKKHTDILNYGIGTLLVLAVTGIIGGPVIAAIQNSRYILLVFILSIAGAIFLALTFSTMFKVKA